MFVFIECMYTKYKTVVYIFEHINCGDYEKFKITNESCLTHNYLNAQVLQ